MVFPSGTPAKLAVGFGREGLPGREVAASPQVAPGECRWTDIEGLRLSIASTRGLVPPLLPKFLVFSRMDCADEIGQN